MFTRKSGPSVARMVAALNITKPQAAELKDMMNEGLIWHTLAYANEMLAGHGDEKLHTSDGSAGIYYINLRNPYATTLMFDLGKYRFLVASWGDIVDSQPRRFAN